MVDDALFNDTKMMNVGMCVPDLKVPSVGRVEIGASTPRHAI